MDVNWRKIVVDIVKYAIGAILGGLGVGLSGCSIVPVCQML